MRNALIAIALIAVATLAFAQEGSFTNTTPVGAVPGATSYTVQTIVLELGEPDGTNSYVQVSLKADTGTVTTIRWDASEGARAMIVALNTANLSTRSLRQRIFDRAVADGKLSGTVGQ